jgi:hypothetical protein
MAAGRRARGQAERRQEAQLKVAKMGDNHTMWEASTGTDGIVLAVFDTCVGRFGSTVESSPKVTCIG